MLNRMLYASWSSFSTCLLIYLSFWFYLFLSYTIKIPYLIARDVTDSMVIFQASNLLYVDQPIGTGFSYSSDRRDIRHSEDGVSNDLYDFLQVGFLFFFFF